MIRDDSFPARGFTQRQETLESAIRMNPDLLLVAFIHSFIHLILSDNLCFGDSSSSTSEKEPSPLPPPPLHHRRFRTRLIRRHLSCSWYYYWCWYHCCCSVAVSSLADFCFCIHCEWILSLVETVWVLLWGRGIPHRTRRHRPAEIGYKAWQG